MNVFLLFLDGVGIGRKDAAVNPFFAAHLPVFRKLAGDAIPYVTSSGQTLTGGHCFAVDANLGMPGLPQSGTGQTAILTGLNAARMFGRHLGPYIPTSLRPIVAGQGLMARVVRAGRSATLSNAFPRRFFEYTESATRRLSAMTFGAVAAGLPLATERELAQDTALSADFVRERWDVMGHPEVLPITPAIAGRHCAAIVERNDLTVFDYWLTDHAGHEQNMPKAVATLERLDQFLGSCLEQLDLRRTLLLSVSDHGNVEDLGVKTHTRNSALGFAVGRRADTAARKVRSLTDVAPFILECLKIPF